MGEAERTGDRHLRHDQHADRRAVLASAHQAARVPRTSCASSRAARRSGTAGRRTRHARARCGRSRVRRTARPDRRGSSAGFPSGVSCVRATMTLRVVTVTPSTWRPRRWRKQNPSTPAPSAAARCCKWQGQCPHCQAWNTLVRRPSPKPRPPAPIATARIAEAGKAQRLSEVEAREESRIASGIEEFDRVLGGGLVPGGVVLIGGEPGIGKSTLLLQALAEIGATRKVLYVSGEESPQQIALRARRLGVDARQRASCSPRSISRKSRRRSSPRSRKSP